MKSRIHNILIALAAFAAAVPSAQALQPSAYPASSPLASGRWVRVTTDSEGIFQLSYDKLRQMGFDSPDKVQVWTADPYELATNLFSEKSANPLITVPSMHTSDGRLLFYGQADARISLESTAYSSTGFTYARNHYARTTSYLLTDATDAEPLRTASYVSAQGRPVTSHLHVELSEEELDYASGGGALAQGRKYEPGQQADFTFRLKNWEPNTYNTSAIFSYVMDVASTSTGQMQIVTDEGVTRLKADNTPYASCESPDVFRYANGSLWFTPAEAQEAESASEKQLVIRLFQVSDSRVSLSSNVLKTTADIPLPPIEMTDVGEGKTMGETFQELYAQLIVSISKAVAATDYLKDLGSSLQKSGEGLSQEIKSGIDQFKDIFSRKK